jgi:peptidoglycan-associated lipoprotein
MLYRLLAVLSLVVFISSCKGKVTKDQSEAETAPVTTEPTEPVIPQKEQEFKTETEASASEENKKTEAAIEEVEVADRVYFDLDSSAISDEAKKILDTQIAWLNSDPTIKITLEGHCDERGTREYNIALGEKRAVSAKKYLVQGGVDGSRIKTISYGKERPAFVGTGESIWSKNRRAVVVVEQ